MVFGFCTDPCTYKECPKGSVCKVFEPTGEAFCDPSCNIDNGGCDDDQDCVLALPVCANPPVQPCVGFVTCVDKGMVHVCKLYDYIQDLNTLLTAVQRVKWSSLIPAIFHVSEVCWYFFDGTYSILS